MSSEKPFWEGKTCEEMAGLHIKVTFKNGDVATGVADKNGDIKSAYVLTLGMGDDLFVPEADIESIELVDDPEYERIEEADDLQEKDIAVTLDGNRYKVIDVEKGRNRFWGLVYGAVGQECIALGFNAFTYGLRPKPRLPDKPGLWLDKDDAVWCFDGDFLRQLNDIEEAWSVSRTTQFAPFRPAKAVEA